MMEEIKKALEGVRESSWQNDGHEVRRDGFYIATASRKGVARFIAAANPAAISELISTLESLQRENEDAKRIDPALIGICEEMEESGGHWQPCTGCYDTLEGHPTQKYDYSPALQSPVGCGCHECGGLGAVWWYMSEQDIADFEKISEELDAEHDLTMRISRLEYLLRSLCKAYAACKGEDHPAYVEARTALASTGGEDHADK